MPRSRSPVTQETIMRAIKAALAAGLDGFEVRIAPDGTVTCPPHERRAE
jgi:hypothetical protein